MSLLNTARNRGIESSQNSNTKCARIGQEKKFNLSRKVHVNDVVTDWSCALAGFLVSTLFVVSPGQS